jgi:hypothetical protein
MPAPGTKKVIVDGAPQFVPADDALLAAILEEGALMQEVYEAAKADLERCKQRLLAYAEPRRNGRSSMSLGSVDGREATIKWSNETRIDETAAAQLEQELRPELFALAFSVKRVFKLSTGWKSLMKSTRPEVERLKARVAAVLDIKPKKPTVKFGADEEADDDEAHAS